MHPRDKATSQTCSLLERILRSTRLYMILKSMTYTKEGETCAEHLFYLFLLLFEIHSRLTLTHNQTKSSIHKTLPDS